MASISSMLAAFLNRRRMISTREQFRMLTPICSALEVHSYKNAIQLCNKELKKRPDNYSVQILKLLALSRASKPLTTLVVNEIMMIVEYLKTNANGAALGDPDVLMFVGSVLGGIDKEAEVLPILAKATATHGTNEDVCVEAFLHYVRVRERKLAQQLSMRMQRTFPRNENYLWWSLVSIILYAKEPNNSSTDLLLTLAERQISAYYGALKEAASRKLEQGQNGKKAIGNGNGNGVGENLGTIKGKEKETPPPTSTEKPLLEFDNAHEFHLITRFLELRLTHSLATSKSPTTSTLILPSSDLLPLSPKELLLAHFASREGDRWCEKGLGNEIWRRECELKYGSGEGGEWERGWRRLKAGLEKGDTNWHTMLYCVRLAFAIATDSSAITTPPPQPTQNGATLLAQTQELFRKLADDGEKGRRERGFVLALLEMGKESRKRGWEENTALLSLVEEYFERFSTKMCAFDDLVPYLEVLKEDEQADLAKKMEQVWSGAGDLTLRELQKAINAAKLARFVAPPLSVEEEVKVARRYLEIYFKALPLGKGLIATDLQPADDFAYLAGQALVAAWDRSRDRSHLETALAILEYASTRSKYKYQLRLLIICVARLLGAPSLALTHYRQLGLKAIQFDTLSHVVLGRAATFSLVSGAGNELGLVEEAEAIKRWYKGGETEAAEMPVRAFTFQNFTKIEDFVVFQDRLNTSVNKYNLLIESVRMKVLAGTLEQSELEDAIASLGFMASHSQVVLSDNRDFQTLPNLQASGAKSIWEQVQLGPRSGQPWLKALVVIYGRMLAPITVVDVQVEKSAELTPSEVALLEFSANARSALDAGLDNTETEATALLFFKDQTAKFSELVENSATLPWELLHTAEITLEGYCLLELAVEQKIAELTASKAADHVKLSKRLRTLRTGARELVKSLGARVNNHAKQVAKLRSKTKENLSPLKDFPLLDDDYLLSCAHGLVESRKGMAEALASAIHRRCSK